MRFFGGKIGHHAMMVVGLRGHGNPGLMAQPRLGAVGTNQQLAADFSTVGQRNIGMEHIAAHAHYFLGVGNYACFQQGLPQMCQQIAVFHHVV